MAPLSAVVLDRGWRWFQELYADPSRLKAGGWFAILFSLQAVAVLELKWTPLGSPLSLRFWFVKALLLAALVIISIILARRGCSLRLKLRLLSGSKWGFVSLFGGSSAGLVYRSITLWGLSATDLRSGILLTSALLIVTGIVSIGIAMVRSGPCTPVGSDAFVLDAPSHGIAVPTRIRMTTSCVRIDFFMAREPPVIVAYITLQAGMQ